MADAWILKAAPKASPTQCVDAADATRLDASHFKHVSVLYLLFFYCFLSNYFVFDGVRAFGVYIRIICVYFYCERESRARARYRTRDKRAIYASDKLRVDSFLNFARKRCGYTRFLVKSDKLQYISSRRCIYYEKLTTGALKRAEIVRLRALSRL